MGWLDGVSPYLESTGWFDGVSRWVEHLYSNFAGYGPAGYGVGADRGVATRQSAAVAPVTTLRGESGSNLAGESGSNCKGESGSNLK